MTLILGACQASSATDRFATAQTQPGDRLLDSQQVRDLLAQARQARANGRRSAARDLLKQAVALAPASGEAHHLLGLVYFEDGDLYNAAVHLDTASRLMSDRFEPCYNLGCILETGGQQEQAIRSYQQALSRRVNRLEILENLGRARLKAGYHDRETLRILTRCMEREKRPEWSNWLQREVARLRGRLDGNGSAAAITQRSASGNGAMLDGSPEQTD